MVDWFAHLDQEGFAILPGIVPVEHMTRLADAYDAVELSATEPDKRIGSTSTRVRDFVNRGKESDEIYLLPQLLDACSRVIVRAFKLSSFHSRTVHPHAIAQDLHVDVAS